MLLLETSPAGDVSWLFYQHIDCFGDPDTPMSTVVSHGDQVPAVVPHAFSAQN
jgi:hypothetical protein